MTVLVHNCDKGEGGEIMTWPRLIGPVVQCSSRSRSSSTQGRGWKRRDASRRCGITAELAAPPRSDHRCCRRRATCCARLLSSIDRGPRSSGPPATPLARPSTFNGSRTDRPPSRSSQEVAVPQKTWDQFHTPI